MRWIYTVLLVVLIQGLLVTTVVAELQVFPTQSGNAAALAEAIQQQMPQGTKVTSYLDKVIVQGDAQAIQLAKELLLALDTPPVLLTLQVRQTSQTARAGESLGAKVRIGPGTDTVAVEGQQRMGNRRRATDQTLKVLLGEAAHIRVGQDVPYDQSWSVFQGDVVGTSSTVAYTSVSTGFEVQPVSLQGNQVRLQITPQMEDLQTTNRSDFNRAPRIRFQQLTSTVLVPLGEWFPLSQHLNQRDAVSRDILRWQTGGGTQQREVWLRIEP